MFLPLRNDLCCLGRFAHSGAALCYSSVHRQAGCERREPLMTVINLRKYCYPSYTRDAFMEVPDKAGENPGN